MGGVEFERRKMNRKKYIIGIIVIFVVLFVFVFWSKAQFKIVLMDLFEEAQQISKKNSFLDSDF
jgi:hypothetical protein